MSWDRSSQGGHRPTEDSLPAPPTVPSLTVPQPCCPLKNLWHLPRQLLTGLSLCWGGFLQITPGFFPCSLPQAGFYSDVTSLVTSFFDIFFRRCHHLKLHTHPHLWTLTAPLSS